MRTGEVCCERFGHYYRSLTHRETHCAMVRQMRAGVLNLAR